MELRKLASIANKLDSLGLTKEADVLDKYIRKLSYDLPDVNLDSLPDSPEEMEDKPAAMMNNVTYAPGSNQKMRGVGPAAKPEKDLYQSSPRMMGPAGSTTPSAADKEDARVRAEIAQSMGKAFKKPQELKQTFGFNFLPTMGKAGTIAQMQSALASCGFDPGPVDGYWGGKTDGAFRDAIHAFAVLSPSEASAEKLMNIVSEIAVGNAPSIPFPLDHVIDMCRIIRDARSRGESVSKGRSIKNYDGSKGGGVFQQKNLRDDATLSSTRAGTPVSGTPRKY